MQTLIIVITVNSLIKTFDQALSNFVKEESLATSSTMLQQNLDFPSACVRSLRAKDKKALKRGYKNVQLFRTFLFS